MSEIRSIAKYTLRISVLVGDQLNASDLVPPIVEAGLLYRKTMAEVVILGSAASFSVLDETMENIRYIPGVIAVEHERIGHIVDED